MKIKQEITLTDDHVLGIKQRKITNIIFSQKKYLLEKNNDI